MLNLPSTFCCGLLLGPENKPRMTQEPRSLSVLAPSFRWPSCALRSRALLSLNVRVTFSLKNNRTKELRNREGP